MDKTITFGIPCYNSSEYMDHCISSIVEGSGCASDVQVVIVDDGSTKDDTLVRAQSWHERFPHIVDVVHQENGGHGRAVMSAIEHAKGAYFKVVDSDDWVDGEALLSLLDHLRAFVAYQTRVDLVVTDYVFEHAEDGKRRTVQYDFALPKGKICGWNQIGHFNMAQYILMHSLCYRTEVLRECELDLPAHTFYVDNIYAYVPLPHCKTLYYLDVELYRYFIGREDQSVNLEVQISRVDQQLAVSRIMMRAYHLYDDVPSKRLRSYMLGHLTLMMSVCSVISKMSTAPDARKNLDDLWHEFMRYDIRMYNRARHGIVGTFTNFRGPVGERVTIAIYHGAQKLMKFN
ncbi:MAG: glycosyltransferase family 2 protein [Coriobacteriales bacterium]|nr:glycosyltransferase family 2 protein [Coriobacteriales bacterium]